MVQFAERRKYQRCTNLVCMVLVSSDGKWWDDIELVDISAGGLKFLSTKVYSIDIPVKINLTAYNMLSEFNLKLEGRVVRLENGSNKNTCSVKLDKINKYSQVQLDEIIKSRITIDNTKNTITEDGIYTFSFITKTMAPKFRRHKVNIQR